MKYLILVITVILFSCETAINNTEEKYSLQGTVIDSAQVPIVGAFVFLDGNISDTTDSEGKFNLMNVVKGEHLLMIEHSGYDTLYKETLFQSNLIQSFTLAKLNTSEFYSLQGTVMDSAQVPIVGAFVFLDGNISDTTDAEGKFNLMNVVKDEHLLMIEHNGYDTLYKETLFQSNLIQSFTLSKLNSSEFYSLQGTVMNSVQVPIVGAFVFLDGNISDTTDAEGKFSFKNIYPGKHSIRITHSDFEALLSAITLNSDSVISFNLVNPEMGDYFPISDQKTFNFHYFYSHTSITDTNDYIDGIMYCKMLEIADSTLCLYL